VPTTNQTRLTAEQFAPYVRESQAATARAVFKAYPHIAKSWHVLWKRQTFKRLYYAAIANPVVSVLETVAPPPTIPQSPEETLIDQIQNEREFIKERGKQRENEAKIKILLKQLDEAEVRYEKLIGIKEDSPRLTIQPRYTKDKNENIAFALASDWHVEENVEADVVNGLNHYDLAESSKRMTKFFQNTLKLVTKERNTTTIDELVLWLGGDLMSGYIHEELMESNHLSPLETIRFLKSHLIAGIDMLLKHGGFRRISIPTNFGNHGRTTEKMKVSTGYKNSYEYMLYKDLEDIYTKSGEKRISFSVVKGEFNFVDCYDTKVRTSHGYHITYAGGVGGVTIPAMKFIAKQNDIVRADFDVWGHHHNFLPHAKFFQNGSLIGVSAYGRRFGGEIPKQSFFTIDKKHGVTTRMPIFVL
jgi:hypothetical protein